MRQSNVATNIDIADLANAADRSRFGGKAAGLAELVTAGERVPPGFAIAAGADIDSDTLSARLATLDADLVAVRSSGLAEDGDITSLAGAYTTVLNVSATADDVTAAIAKVRDADSTLPVVVQAMLEPDSAGVAFSANPVAGDDEVVVSATSGLGDRLLSGEIDGEQFVVGDGDDLPTGDTLDATELATVVGAVRRVAERSGHAVDVEWAFADGDLFLLQARPITALPTPPSFEVPPGPWEKDVSHSPGPQSPMATSLAVQGERVMAGWAERFGLMVADVAFRSFGGETYSQAVPIIGKATSTAPPPPWWVLGIAARVVPAIRRRMATAQKVFDSGLMDDLPRRWYEEWKPEFIAIGEHYRTTDLTALDDRALVQHGRDVHATVQRGLDVHFDLFIPYLVGVHGFVETCRDVLGWDEGRSLALLSGASPASAAQARDLQELVARIRTDEMANAVANADGAIAAVTAVDPAAGAALGAWADRHGFRTTDYDVAAPTVAEVPGLIDRLIRAEFAGESGLSAATGNGVEDARAELSGADLTRFDKAYAQALVVYPLREDNVHPVGMVPLAALRFMLLELGRRLADRDAIDAPDDVMFLEWDEAVPALFDGSDLAPTARRRRAEHAWVVAHPGPMHYGPEPAPPPDMRGLPEGGRRINSAIMWAMSQELSPPAEGGSSGLKGTPAGAGHYTGPARIIRSEADFHKLRPGDVLVAPIATPSWAAIFAIPGAIVCDGGGPLSHTAVVAREHGLPAVMGVTGATTTLTDGQIVTVDGTTGAISVE